MSNSYDYSNQQVAIRAILKEYCAGLSLPSGLSKEIETVVMYIHQNIFDPSLSLDTVRCKCNLSNHNIFLSFHREMSITPGKYIKELRMGAADRLIRRTCYSIHLIAYELGYAHPENFSRDFKKWSGLTPSKCRDHSRIRYAEQM